MRYLKFNSLYDKYPSTKVEGKAYLGYEDIRSILSSALKEKNIVAFEMYPGVDKEEVKENLISKLGFDRVIDIEEAAYDEEELNRLLKRNLTDDRVFGLMSHYEIEEFYHLDRVKEIEESIKGRVAILGFGACLVKHDALIYLDLTRWEIQLRYRSGMPNFRCTN